MKARRQFLLAVVCAALSVTVAASPSLAQNAVIKIGAPLPLTGALAPEGLKQKEGYDLWAKAVEKAGGIKVGSKRYDVKLVYYDYESATPKAVQLTEKLMTDDKVNFLFSPFGSGATKATSSLSEKYKIPTVSSTASSEPVFNPNFKYLFGILTSNEAVGRALTVYFKQQDPKIKTAAIYSRNDFFPLALSTAIDEAAKKNGYDVVYFEKYPVNAADHSAALTNLRAKQADWIFVSGYTDDLIRIRKQMVELKVSASIITMLAGPAYPEFISSLGAAANGVSSVTWWYPTLGIKTSDVFGSTANYAKLFEETYHKTADYVQAASSAAGVVLQMAIEKAGSIDPQKVRDELASTKFTTFYGEIKFGPSGQNNIANNPIFQIQHQKVVITSPASIKQGNFELIK